MSVVLTFEKSGLDIKNACKAKMAILKARLDKRHADLDRILEDKNKLKSYLIRQTEQSRSSGSAHGNLYSKGEVSSEEFREIDQLCRRIYQIDKELKRLALIRGHLSDDKVFELDYPDLVAYGFEASEDTA